MSDQTKTCGHCHFKCPSGANVCGHCHAEFRLVEEEASFLDKIVFALKYGSNALVLCLVIVIFTDSFWNWNLWQFDIVWFIFGGVGAFVGFATETKTVEKTFR